MAEKLKMMSDDIIQENIDYIAERFIKDLLRENGLHLKVLFIHI